MSKTKTLLIFWLISSALLFFAIHYIAGSLQENVKIPMVSEGELLSFPFYKTAVVSIAVPLLLYLAAQLPKR